PVPGAVRVCRHLRQLPAAADTLPPAAPRPAASCGGAHPRADHDGQPGEGPELGGGPAAGGASLLLAEAARGRAPRRGGGLPVKDSKGDGPAHRPWHPSDAAKAQDQWEEYLEGSGQRPEGRRAAARALEPEPGRPSALPLWGGSAGWGPC